jgi:two-component system KDP operon response regulator KdpE
VIDNDPDMELARRGAIPALVLVIDDEEAIRRSLRTGLESQGYRCLDASTGEEGIAQAEAHSPDVVLLDLGLPDLEAPRVVQRIREGASVPIIVLTARGQEHDRIQALDGGADDYVTKPFSMPDLLARMRVALRRRSRAGSGDEESVIEHGLLRIDLARRQVTLGGIPVALTRIEYQLLTTLARHAGRVLTHAFLLKEIWGQAYTSKHHYLRVYMAQLRHKLEADPGRPRLLLTETGVGYRMAEAL